MDSKHMQLSDIQISGVSGGFNSVNFSSSDDLISLYKISNFDVCYLINQADPGHYIYKRSLRVFTANNTLEGRPLHREKA